MIVRLYTSNDNKTLFVEPVDFSIDELPRLSIYLLNIQNSCVENENKYSIKLDGVDAISVYARVKAILRDRLGLEIQLEQSAETRLSEAENESRRFANFANKALKIRNNNIDDSELQDFVKKLSMTDFRRTLMPYQLLASYHIAFSQNACNFSVPGSGKTTTVLAAYEYLRKTSDTDKKLEKLLVIGPLSAFGAWKNEFKECFGYAPEVFEIMGGVSLASVEDALLRSKVPYDIVIASYGSVPGKITAIKQFLKNNRCMVVLDEAHRIKNVEDGIQSNATLQLADDAKSRVILTGTPAANSYVDLFNLYKFIWPANNIIGYSVAQLANMSRDPDDCRVRDLTDRISPFFIRVKKDDLHLPEATYHAPIKLEMSPIQKGFMMISLILA